MVKSVIQKQQHENGVSSSSCKYKGVRKRKWGKYVSEIRLPNSRERIWLGSYDTAEKAARAFDAALFCLRGRTAKFNFPDNPPDIVNGRSLTPAEIQVAAARFAKSETQISHSGLGRVEDLDPGYSCSLSSSQLHVDSPSLSISNAVVPLEDEMTKIPSDPAFLDTLTTMGAGVNNVADYGIFPGFDDFSGDLCLPPLAIVDYGDENWDNFCSQGSFLWNF